MPPATKPAPTRKASARNRLNGRVSAVSIVLASIATLVIVFGLLQSADQEPVRVRAVPAQPDTVPRSFAAPVEPPELTPPHAGPAAPETDAQGFIGSVARCDPGQHAVAIARTTRSAMVICREADGTYVYTGTRLHDGASLRVDDVRVIPAGFEARNADTTYRLSATELVVISGEELVSRDPIVEYRGG